MTFALVLLLLGGFLVGGAWSVWRSDTGARTGPRVFLTVSLLVAAVMASAAGILRLV